MDLLTANDRPGEYPASWYAATATPLARFPLLAGETRADVCVVGGGYTGLSAALHLAEAGLDVVLLEANRVGWGASGRNGGQVGSGQRQDQDWLERTFGPGPARALWDMGEDAKALVRDLIRRHAIACDLAPGVIYAAHKPAYVPAYQAYAAKLAHDYGYAEAEPLDHAGIAALDLFDEAPEITELLGAEFCHLYKAIKRDEVETFLRVISPWERAHLLLNV